MAFLFVISRPSQLLDEEARSRYCQKLGWLAGCLWVNGRKMPLPLGAEAKPSAAGHQLPLALQPMLLCRAQHAQPSMTALDVISNFQVMKLRLEESNWLVQGHIPCRSSAYRPVFPLPRTSLLLTHLLALCQQIVLFAAVVKKHTFNMSISSFLS